MKAKDLMRKDVFTVREEDSVDDVIETLVREHIHGAPVVDGMGLLTGVVTQQDAYFSSMTRSEASGVGGTGSGRAGLKVRDIMTSPAVSATEDTDVRQLCRMMHRLRIHRIPVVRDGKVTGIVSSLDVCGLVARGESVA